jgi:alkanesulfonate monooxygenase SsuD/methylene tetrahydromethanopterin reductase-like flavin-dependent oxidoreductase (luciferase family)
MRVGLALDGADWPTLMTEAQAAEAIGFSFGWIAERDASAVRRNACAVACALAPHTVDLRLVAEIPASSHPIGLAEELAVSDLMLNGRLTGALSGEDAGEAEEALEIIQLALAPRPFRHSGTRWVLPADDTRVRVTPAAAQLEMGIWLYGDALEGLAERRRIPWIDGHRGADQVSSRAVSAMRPEQSGHTVRPAICTPLLRPDGELAVEEMVELLRAEHAAWGLDCPIIELPCEASASVRLELIASIGALVAPQLQLDALPPELVSSWDAQLAELPTGAGAPRAGHEDTP